MTNEIVDISKNVGYIENNKTKLIIGSCDVEFRVFCRDNTPTTISKFEVLPIKTLSLEERINKEKLPIEEKKRLVLPKKYVDVPETKTGYFKLRKIDLNTFRKQIDDHTFIDRYINSIKTMIRYKLRIYQERILDTQKERDRTKKKMDRCLAMGIENRQLEEMYPLYKFYNGYILDLEDILEDLLKKLNTSPEEVKNNLIDALENQEYGLASLIGRDDIKEQIIEQLYAFSISYKSYTLSFNNWCLMGPSGIGKTALAKVLGYVFSKSGILCTSFVKIVTRCDLIGTYIGQTSPKTRSILIETLEGVLFIDEAYEIYKLDSPRDFGSEAITEIVNFMDKYIGCSIIIVAGYENEMKSRFFEANQGLNRRFPHQKILSMYTYEELTSIMIQFLYQSDLSVGADTANYLYSKIKRLSKEEIQNQAGNLLELSSKIKKLIYTSFNLTWGKYEDDITILDQVFG